MPGTRPVGQYEGAIEVHADTGEFRVFETRYASRGRIDAQAVILILLVVASTVASIAAYRRLARIAATHRDGSLNAGTGSASGVDSANEAIA